MKRLHSEKLRELVARRAENDIQTGHIFGASVLVRQEGRVVLEEQFGYADGKKERPLDPECIFRIASMTKPVTAVLTMMGVERGWFDLHDPVERHLPAFSRLCQGSLGENGEILRGGPLKQKVEIFHLLTHTSLLDYGKVYSAQWKKASPEGETKHPAWDATLASALEFYSTLAMEKEPGVQNSYSGTVAFDVLAGILEKYSGKSYGDLLRDELTEPLGMVDTTFVPSEEQWKRTVIMHGQKDGVAVEVERPENCVFEYTPVTHPLGGAGLISTVRDYDRFAQMLVNGGLWEGKRFLKEETVGQMGSPAIPQLEGSSNRWGLGMRVIDNEKKNLPVGCFGWSGAYGTHFWVDPENRITAVYMKNSTHDGGGGAITSANFEKDVVAAME